jgi:hypothetical protein
MEVVAAVPFKQMLRYSCIRLACLNAIFTTTVQEESVCIYGQALKNTGNSADVKGLSLQFLAHPFDLLEAENRPIQAHVLGSRVATPANAYTALHALFQSSEYLVILEPQLVESE